MNNYKNNNIPDIKKLINEIDRESTVIMKSNQYKFSDFYLETEEEYFLNKEFILSNFNLNSKKTKKSKKNDELKGIYIFLEENKPIYVGISQTILRRIKQHFTGKNHNESTLSFNLASIKYEKEKNKKFKGNRKDFPYNKYRSLIQEHMQESFKIIIDSEEDDYKLYLKEFYLSCYLKTKYNTFETH